jgi:U2-associated protein SR140
MQIIPLHFSLSSKQDERHKIGSRLGPTKSSHSSRDHESDDGGDPNSTSLYVANLSTSITENQLRREFDKYGDILQVRIIPKDVTSTRPTTYGFVSFVDRRDAEYAKDRMQGKELSGNNLRISWGKAVKPSAIPQTSSSHSSSHGSSYSQSPSQSDQHHESSSSSGSPGNKIEVHIPQDHDVIDKLATNVVKFGIQFEKLVSQKDSSLGFISNTSLPEYAYYRWRIYSVLQGDNMDSWKTSPFQMVVNGPIWHPPPLPIKKHNREERPATTSSITSTDKRLSQEDKETFEDMLRELTLERNKIKLAMGFALDHADVSSDIIQSLFESLSISETPTPSKLARLYLLSDILHNSSAPVPNASSYRRDFESKLPSIFESFREAHRNIGGRITAENFKGQILRLIRIWEGWSLYPMSLTTELHDIFIAKEPEKTAYQSDYSSSSPSSREDAEEEEDLDGVPI